MMKFLVASLAATVLTLAAGQALANEDETSGTRRYNRPVAERVCDGDRCTAQSRWRRTTATRQGDAAAAVRTWPRRNTYRQRRGFSDRQAQRSLRKDRRFVQPRRTTWQRRGFSDRQAHRSLRQNRRFVQQRRVTQRRHAYGNRFDNRYGNRYGNRYVYPNTGWRSNRHPRNRAGWYAYRR